MGTIKDTRSISIYMLVLSLAVLQTNSQRVVPGVNPQHYQQVPVQQQQYHQPPPAPQQYQQHAPGVNPQQYQQQQQQQQVPQAQYQQQQVPVHQQAPQHQQQHQQQQVPQQMHQQVPQGHVPQQQQVPHGQHGQHGQPQQVLHASNMDHERAHIQEHMQVPIDTSKMSEAELQFHYFKMHDSDNNNKLDGCELIKSLIHWHGDEKNPKKDKDAGTGEKDGAVYTDQGLSDVIDYVLSTMDYNNDGFVDYAEYRKSEEGQAKDTKKH